jgi:magnesium-transporting ATPase (P-type)
MTIAVIDPESTDHVLVLCKGSLEAIRGRLCARDIERHTTQAGLWHARKFAEKGGRVFCFAFKVNLLIHMLS